MERQLRLRIVGPGVRPGRIAVRDLQRIVQPLEQAARAMSPAPPHQDQKQPLLFLSGIDEGSAVAEMTYEIDEQPTLLDHPQDPIQQLIHILTREADELPKNAAAALARMASKLPDGIEYVELSCGTLDATPRITRPEREPRIIHREHLSRSGRLLEVNFAKNTAKLQLQRDQRKKQVKLRFPDHLAYDMQQATRQLVVVEGEATFSQDDKIKTIDVERVSMPFDDRHALWAPKRFQWPQPEDRIDNIDYQEFLRTSRDRYDDEGGK